MYVSRRASKVDLRGGLAYIYILHIRITYVSESEASMQSIAPFFVLKNEHHHVPITFGE